MDSKLTFRNELELEGKLKDKQICFSSYFSGGGSNCSVFCALSILHEQFKNDQYVDVCRTAKKLKTQRPHMIETYVSLHSLFIDQYFHQTLSLIS